MNRREFLVNAGIALLALPAAYTLTGCGKSEDDAPAPATGFSVVSSVDFAHTHSVVFPFTDLTSPPSGGKTFTSEPSTHVHTITLTRQQLTDLNTGATESTVSNPDPTGHNHTWSVKKP